LIIERREDADRGGYDSYVFAEDHRHPLWKSIGKEHLKMFNGGFGGEVVSQHDVICDQKSEVLARCGLKLGVVAVSKLRYGKGKVIISRLQLRSRLRKTGQSDSSDTRLQAPTTRSDSLYARSPGQIPELDSLYTRRPDPVLQQYLINLISYACGKDQ
jgi:hypothetical protein